MRDLLLIDEMISAALQAIALERMASGRLHDDRIRREALLWNLTILGEAAAQLSASSKARFANVPWHRPIGLRNRLVHGYWSIDLSVVGTTATDVLPAFLEDLRTVRAVLASDEPEPPDDLSARHGG